MTLTGRSVGGHHHRGEAGPKTIYNRFARWSERGILAKDVRCGRRGARRAGACGTRQQPCEDSSLRQRWKGGAETQAIGVTKGGRNSKVHALVDEECRPWAFVLTPGNTADCIVAETCASLIPGIAE